MPTEHRHRKKRRRKKRKTFQQFWQQMARNHGNYFYNAVFFGALSLVALFLIFYFLGWLEFLGLKYEPSMPKIKK